MGWGADMGNAEGFSVRTRVILTKQAAPVSSFGTATVKAFVAHAPCNASPDQTALADLAASGHDTDAGFAPRPTASHTTCLVAGTRIDTAFGPIAVEALRPGDRIITRDIGLQTLRRCGHHTVASQGAHAAISIPAGTFGDHGSFRVAPQTVLLLSGWLGEFYFGEDKVLVKAADLARAGLLRQDHSGCPVTYHHLLFDHPARIRAEGLWCECPLPDPRPPKAPHPEPSADLFARFPELQRDPLAYGLPARPQTITRAAGIP